MDNLWDARLFSWAWCAFRHGCIEQAKHAFLRRRRLIRTKHQKHAGFIQLHEGLAAGPRYASPVSTTAGGPRKLHTQPETVDDKAQHLRRRLVVRQSSPSVRAGTGGASDCSRVQAQRIFFVQNPGTPVLLADGRFFRLHQVPLCEDRLAQVSCAES